MGPKKGPTAKQLVIQHELEALKMHMKACCRARGLDYTQQNVKELTAAIVEKAETFKSMTKLICQGPSVQAPFAEVVMDLLAGYSKVKNLCFWGCDIGDDGLRALADLFQSAGSPWFKGTKLVHLEITCDGNTVPPAEWPGMSRKLRTEGITAASAIQGPGAALPSLFFRDTPMVVAPDVIAEDDDTQEADNMDCAASTTSGAGALAGFMSVPQPYAFDGTLGQPLAKPWGEAAVNRLANTLGTKGLRLKVLILDHNVLGGTLITLLARGIVRCHSLKQLSLAYCGLDETSAPALNLLMETEAGTYGVKDAQSLHLQNLNLQGNQLGPDGLSELAAGIRGNMTLTVLNLADIGVCEDDLAALADLRDALRVHPQMFKVDFGMNQIGSAGVQLLLPMLAACKNIKAIRVTKRIDRPTAKALHELLMDRCIKKKKVLKKKKTVKTEGLSAAELLAGGGAEQLDDANEELVEVEVSADDLEYDDARGVPGKADTVQPEETTVDVGLAAEEGQPTEDAQQAAMAFNDLVLA